MSNHAIAILLLITVLVLGAILWPKIRHDAVGRRTRTRRQATGLQGQVGEWLYWDATVRRPDLKRYAEDAKPEPPERPADRAVHAVVVREAMERNVDLPQAYQRVKQRTKDPLARAFLNGQLGRAVRLHWRRRFKGPDALFPLWFYLVATVRYGRRHLFLETMTAALQELSKP